MILNVKKWIYAKLIADAALVAAVGDVKRIIYGMPNNFNILPVLSYTESSQVPYFWSDNSQLGATVSFDFDIFTVYGTDPQAIAEKLDAVLTANLWSLEVSMDFMEPDLKIQHKSLKYTRTLSSGDLI
jgi:hypothetical protein